MKKPTKKIETIQQLFKIIGGATNLAASLGLHAFTVENWRRCGVPQKYWQNLIDDYGITEKDLHTIWKNARKQ